MQLSQQASYKAEIHELYTEMLNMQEKSGIKAALSASMCRLKQPSLTVEAKPENVLNAASAGRRSSLMSPVRLTTEDFELQKAQQCDMAQVQWRNSTVVKVIYQLHLPNGVIETFEHTTTTKK